MDTKKTTNGLGEVAGEERARLATALRGAPEAGLLNLHYQPLVRSGDGEVLGLEALLRWRDPELGEISPRRLVPIAEECGIMPVIGRWVVRTRRPAARRLAAQRHRRRSQPPRQPLLLRAQRSRAAELHRR